MTVDHRACSRSDVTAWPSFLSTFSPFPHCSSFLGWYHLYSALGTRPESHVD